MRRSNERGAWCRYVLTKALVWMALVHLGVPAWGADPPAAPAEAIGQFVTVRSPIDDAVFGEVSRAALGLQSRAQQEHRRGVLVLEVSPGVSQFHHVQGLAKFLLNDVPGLATVAWVPASVRGNNAAVALACQEIVMRPDAELGDLSMGKALDADDRMFLVNLANRRHNTKVSEALVLAMADRERELIWVQLEAGAKPAAGTEARVVLPGEFERLLRSKAVILKHETIKAPGTEGLFSGEKARAYDILAVHTARTRDEVADLYHLPHDALREDPRAGRDVKALIIRVNDVITPQLEQFVTRQVQRSQAAGVNLLIFEIESPGGYLEASQNLANVILDLPEGKVRSVAYIPKSALSGAALIALACDEIYLHPEGQIGDAGPLEIRAGGVLHRAPEKVLSPLKAYLKTLGDRRHRPAGLLEAMADRKLEVFQAVNQETGRIWYFTEHELVHETHGEWVKGPPVPEAGNDLLLTVTGGRAHELQIAETPVKDLDSLKQRLGLPLDRPVPVSSQTWVDTLIFELNTPAVTGLMFILGIMCIYLELHFPSGLFGIGAGLCFALFFWSRFLGGTAGWLEVTLFLLGAGCLALEIFVIPGFGVFGVSGGLLLLFSLILASQTFIIPVTQQDFEQLARSVGTLSGALLGVIVLAALLTRYLPTMPLIKSLVLTPPGAEDSTGEPRLNPHLAGDDAESGSLLHRDVRLIGRTGTARTMLRPAGKALIGDELVDVISEGPFIPMGTPIEVMAVEGNRVIVRDIS